MSAQFTEPEPPETQSEFLRVVEANNKRNRERLDRWFKVGKVLGAIGCTTLVLLALGAVVSFGYVLFHFIRKFW